MITIERNNTLRSYRLNPAQILVLGFASVILIGALLLNLPIASQSGESVGFVNSIFTATSAVCVTGLVVVDTGTYWTVFGKTIILLLIQIGGLGFMTMATLVAFIIGKRISLRERLIMQEALNQLTISGLVRLTQHILITTFIIEGIGAFFLSLKFIPIYGTSKGILYGIFHSISAFCNAGFDLIGNGRSLTPFVDSALVNIVIWLLIIVGGLGFTVVMDVIKFKKFSKLTLHTKLVLSITAILILTGFVLIFALEFTNPDTLGNLSIKGKFLGSMFHSITPRTAGFNTLPMDKLRMASKFFIIIFMFIGGSPSSTAGGIKTTTAGVLVLKIISTIRGKNDTEIFNRRIAKDVIDRAFAILAIGMLWILIVTMILSITEANQDFLHILFETASAFGTVGLTLGLTPNLSIIGKIVISLTMFAGRLGALTIVFALGRKQEKNKGLVRYPEGKVMVG
ncbi:TrkH family potassium uptake protein [Maledivibacter halophilus]|uniref:Trk system potassium uptake protein TrkH n=1 Tax=Maledivibacter halophilus TaxID=36842 RepID=A0A1T5IWG0_9FIRM|nr:TrkH family potassium uptake protein [Maledivibacter halophilus]SKC43536.1 trk system potassium uptake protein TrkH [Maledivibacter halophilus]